MASSNILSFSYPPPQYFSFYSPKRSPLLKGVTYSLDTYKQILDSIFIICFSCRSHLREKGAILIQLRVQFIVMGKSSH